MTGGLRGRGAVEIKVGTNGPEPENSGETEEKKADNLVPKGSRGFQHGRHYVFHKLTPGVLRQ